MRPAMRILEDGAQAGARGRRNDGLVGFDNIDLSAGEAEFARNDVASDFGADEQYAFALDAATEAADHGLGDILLRHDGNFKAALLDRFSRRRADGGDFYVFQRSLAEMQFFHPLQQGFDSVDAGED